jgi:hypothetical protein
MMILLGVALYVTVTVVTWIVFFTVDKRVDKMTESNRFKQWWRNHVVSREE